MCVLVRSNLLILFSSRPISSCLLHVLYLSVSVSSWAFPGLNNWPIDWLLSLARAFVALHRRTSYRHCVPVSTVSGRSCYQERRKPQRGLGKLPSLLSTGLVSTLVFTPWCQNSALSTDAIPPASPCPVPELVIFPTDSYSRRNIFITFLLLQSSGNWTLPHGLWRQLARS